MKAQAREKYWHEIEAKLRTWAFHVYFNKSFRSEHDPMARFLKALKASRRPIRNRELALWWYRHEGCVTDADIKALSI